MKAFTIREAKLERTLGQSKPAFIVAEMSANHHQNFDKAIEIIDAAAEAKADAIKVQTYTPDTITLDCNSEPFQVKVNKAWKGQTLYSLYEKACTPWEWQPKLKKHAESQGLFFFSAPFDVTAVDFLQKMDVPIYKVSSFEVGHIPLLEKIGKTGKPTIVSIGLATEKEISLAVKTLKEAGCPAITLLRCIVSYPAKPEQMNLATIPDIEKRFRVFAGLSDHSLGWKAAILAANLGAKVIEKHLIISRSEGGPDANFSLEAAEFKQLVKTIRESEKTKKLGIDEAEAKEMIGQPSYGIGKGEAENIVFRPSIWVVKDIRKGETFSEENILVRRPNHGLKPRHYSSILGKKAGKDLKKCTALKWDCLEK
jgi:pseudaminic acid synthase